MNSALGAILGLAVAIVLIIRRFSPVYSLLVGAVVGGLLGGMGLEATVANMISGVKDITPAIIRIIAAGVLSGVLIKTGAAASISNTIVNRLGQRHIFLALALSAMLLTAVGVFVDVAVITVAPIAIIIAERMGISRMKMLLAMVGGGKCGNIISPNPNTIIAAENFDAPLSSVMLAGVVPAVVGLLIVVYLIVPLLPTYAKGVTAPQKGNTGSFAQEGDLPSFAASMVAPLTVIVLLMLRPVAGIAIDPLIALPIGGVAGIVATRRWRDASQSVSYGLEKMSVVAVLLVSTGAIAGIVKASTLTDMLLSMLGQGEASQLLLAPLSSIVMSAATASTTAGATIASASFAPTILAAGLQAVWGAALVNVGATVLDHLPHGSFFHATSGSMELSMKEGLRLIPYMTLIGLTLTVLMLGAYFVLA
ncbi:MAG: GntP family permease [Alistipes sp.]|nr:GntP family permease [Alistipes sp.]MBR3775779.1 GntP family permease [Alistipes sp.]